MTSSPSVAIKSSDAMGFINMVTVLVKGLYMVHAQCTENSVKSATISHTSIQIHCHLVQLYGVDTWKEVVLGVIEILLYQWYRYLATCIRYDNVQSHK